MPLDLVIAAITLVLILGGLAWMFVYIIVRGRPQPHG